MDMRQHEEYIADMALDPAKKLLLTARYGLKAVSLSLSCVKCPPQWELWPSLLLLCSLYSGDGCLGVFNIRRRRFELLSEPQSGDLTSVTIMKVQLGMAGWGCARDLVRHGSTNMVCSFPAVWEEGSLWLQ